MQTLTTLILDHGLLLVFAVTLAARAGLPLPAAPLLVVAGGVAAAAPGGMAQAWAPALAVAVAANVVGDGLWFYAGRRYGPRVMGLLRRFSRASGADGVGGETLMQRRGGWALLAAKFVPGVSLVAAPLAGVLGMPARRFIAYDVLASAVWSALFLGLGAGFSQQVGVVLDALAQVGLIAVPLLVGGGLGYFLKPASESSPAHR